MSYNNRIVYTDILRIFACISVVIIHVSGEFVVVPGLLGTKTWWFANILDSLIRWSVPVFFMLSGAFLLSGKKNYSLYDFAKKRVSKVLIPFIIWSVIYVLFDFKDKLRQLSLKDAVKLIITGNTHYHLWFFYSLIGLYIAAPVLKIIVQKCDRKLLVYFVTLCFVNSSVLGLLSKFFNIYIGFSIPLGSTYVGYFVLGNLLLEVEIKKYVRNIIYAVGVMGVLVTMLGSYFMSAGGNGIDLYFYEYSSINTVAVTLAVFVMFKSIDWEDIIGTRRYLYRCINVLTDASLGIYLIHPIFLKYSEEVPFMANMKSAVYIIIGSIGIYLISFISANILKKTPVIRHIVP